MRHRGPGRAMAVRAPGRQPARGPVTQPCGRARCLGAGACARESQCRRGGRRARRHAASSARDGERDVKYVNLGKTGLRVSRVCLGMMSFGTNSERPWVLDEAAAEPIVKAAVDGGITFFDTADVYSGGTSEMVTGRLLPRMFARRDDYVLATKVFMPV